MYDIFKLPEIKIIEKEGMMKSIYVILAIIFISAPVQASSVDWEIQFFDQEGVQVGEGDFSYDPDRTEQFSSYSVAPDFIPEVRQINTTFTSLNWTVNNEEWSDQSAWRGAWWGGSLIGDRFFYDFDDVLMLGSFRGQFLLLSFDSQNPSALSATTGSWEQIVFGFSNQDPFTEGTWRANQTSAVPIPGVFVLFGSGLISMIMFGMRSIRKK